MQKTSSAYSHVQAYREKIDIFKNPPQKEKRYKVDYEKEKEKIADKYGNFRTKETRLKQEIGATEIEADLLDGMLDIFGKIKDCPRYDTKHRISEMVNKLPKEINPTTKEVVEYHPNPIVSLEKLNEKIEDAYEEIAKSNNNGSTTRSSKPKQVGVASSISPKKGLTKGRQFSSTMRNLKTDQILGLKGVGLEQIDEEK